MVLRGEARFDATERLRASGDPTASLDADVLLAHVCGIGREQLYAHLDERLAEEQRAAYAGLVERRVAGEPVAYLRGWKEFYGLRFAVDQRVLIPRPETEVLVEAVLAFLDAAAGAQEAVGASKAAGPAATRPLRVADVGTGSGAIAVAVAVHRPSVRVIATDASADALAVAAANATAHGVAERVDLRQGDLLAPVDGTVDVVAANLPYLRDDAFANLTGERTSLAFEPRRAVVAGPDGLDVIRRCVAQLPGKLASGGAAFFECDPPQAAAIAELLRGALGAPTRVHHDLTGAARVVGIIRP